MPPKSRPATEKAQKPVEAADTTPEAPPDRPDGGDAAAAAPPGEDDTSPAGTPGVYRFTWPYSCTYNLPGQSSRVVEPGEDVFWPDGPPDALWEPVDEPEPAPAPSDNTRGSE